MSKINSDWIQRFHDCEIPIMSHSRDFILQHQDTPGITISRILKVIQFDPGLCLRLLIEAGKSKKNKITCLTHAMLMMGMPRVLSYPESLQTTENTVPKEIQVLLRNIYHRQFFQANLARRWAKQRSDNELEEIFSAAIVRSAIEWLLVMVDPELSKKCQGYAREKRIPFKVAIEEIANLPYASTSVELANTWNLPERVAGSFEDEKTEQCLWIERASEVVTFADVGWFEPETTKVLTETATQLHKTDAKLIKDIHQSCAQNSRLSFSVQNPSVALAAELVRLPGPKYEPKIKRPVKVDKPKIKNNKRQIDILKECLTQIETNHSLGYQDLISHTFKALNQGLELDRIVFALINPDKKSLKIRFSLLPDTIKSEMKKLTIRLDEKNLFERILSKPSIVWSRDENCDRYRKLLPATFFRMTQSDHFLMISLFVDHKPIGVIYADKIQGKTIELQQQKYFKRVCQSLEKALQGLSDRNHQKQKAS